MPRTGSGWRRRLGFTASLTDGWFARSTSPPARRSASSICPRCSRRAQVLAGLLLQLGPHRRQLVGELPEEDGADHVAVERQCAGGEQAEVGLHGRDPAACAVPVADVELVKLPVDDLHHALSDARSPFRNGQPLVGVFSTTWLSSRSFRLSSSSCASRAGWRRGCRCTPRCARSASS